MLSPRLALGRTEWAALATWKLKIARAKGRGLKRRKKLSWMLVGEMLHGVIVSPDESRGLPAICSDQCIEGLARWPNRFGDRSEVLSE